MRIPTLGSDPHLADVFRAFPETVRPLLEYHDLLLRGPSPLTVGERELIAAYVSGLNACDFCSGAHQIIAEAAGIDAAVFQELLDDVDTAPVSEALKPVFHYVRTLTLSPARTTDTQTQAIRDAGWDDRAIHDAVAVCGLFNLMNRLVEGMGVKSSEAVRSSQKQRNQTVSSTQYRDFGKMLGIE
ncbi:MAG TPA: peroxidase [Thiolapillus brandeum]|uniref:Peroxidase n=1 Tax=Thiolapillus brandeum TaxID=1076588 RepID=A0A831RYB6_9GAMM|nr:peroxidase [Thiolapillus brandeum]